MKKCRVCLLEIRPGRPHPYCDPALAAPSKRAEAARRRARERAERGNNSLSAEERKRASEALAGLDPIYAANRRKGLAHWGRRSRGERSAIGRLPKPPGAK